MPKLAHLDETVADMCKAGLLLVKAKNELQPNDFDMIVSKVCLMPAEAKTLMRLVTKRFMSPQDRKYVLDLSSLQIERMRMQR